MKLLVKTKSITRLNLFIDWLINMLGYALILTVVSLIFKNVIKIDSAYYGVWGLIAAIIIWLLNKIVKPIIVWFTLPLTGLTMGLFYPVINVIILYLTNFIMGEHFQVNGFWMVLIVAILISILNIFMEKAIIGPLTRKER